MKCRDCNQTICDDCVDIDATSFCPIVTIVRRFAAESAPVTKSIATADAAWINALNALWEICVPVQRVRFYCRECGAECECCEENVCHGCSDSGSCDECSKGVCHNCHGLSC
jgi:hypothetical protein